MVSSIVSARHRSVRTPQFETIDDGDRQVQAITMHESLVEVHDPPTIDDFRSLYRQIPPPVRSQIKFLAAGAAGLLAQRIVQGLFDRLEESGSEPRQIA